MDLEKKLQQKAGLMAADMNGETVMMDADSGKYYNLGAVGGEIWRILSTPMTVKEVLNHLQTVYDVSSEQCEADTIPFLEKLLESGILKELDS